MTLLLLAGVVALAFSNGANDNFKGVATLWGSGSANYGKALTWATVSTFLGSIAAAWFAQGLVPKFSGTTLLAHAPTSQTSFLAAVVLAAAATVLLASRLGLPISTTHALTGALAGAGIASVGAGQLHWTALIRGFFLPLLLSPVLALVLTLIAAPVIVRLGAGKDCVCVDAAVQIAGAGPSGEALGALAVPIVHRGSRADCAGQGMLAQWSVTNTLHWLSASAISFARGLNDTPKIAAALLVVPAILPLSLAGPRAGYLVLAPVMALGGWLGAVRVARTLSKKITPMALGEATAANLVSAVLVAAASGFGLPVSTTHVTSGGIFGLGLRRRGEADMRRIREIVLAWLGTLPIAAALGALCYLVLAHR